VVAVLKPDVDEEVREVERYRPRRDGPSRKNVSGGRRLSADHLRGTVGRIKRECWARRHASIPLKKTVNLSGAARPGDRISSASIR